MGQADRCKPAISLGNKKTPCDDRAAQANFRIEDCRIIIVDDDPDHLALVADLLDHRGYDIVSFTCPIEARLFLEHNPRDVLISDVQMPGMSGLQLADWMNSKSDGTNIILMSGATRDAIPLKTNWRFIAKPARLHNILDTLKDI